MAKKDPRLGRRRGVEESAEPCGPAFKPCHVAGEPTVGTPVPQHTHTLLSQTATRHHPGPPSPAQTPALRRRYGRAKAVSFLASILSHAL